MMKTYVGITGHRPSYFKNAEQERLRFLTRFGYAFDSLSFLESENLILANGGAPGVDYWALEYALKHKIPFELYLPFSVSELKKFRTKKEYEFLNKCIKSNFCMGQYEASKTYNSRAYQQRNRSVVDKSFVVLAYWTGNTKSGTFNCIKYALQRNKLVWNLYEKRS